MKTLFIIMSVVSTVLSAQAGDAPTAAGLALYHNADTVCEPKNKKAAGIYVIMNRTRSGNYQAEIRRGSKVQEILFDQVNSGSWDMPSTRYSSNEDFDTLLWIYDTQRSPSTIEEIAKGKEYIRYGAVIWLRNASTGYDEEFSLSCISKYE